MMELMRRMGPPPGHPQREELMQASESRVSSDPLLKSRFDEWKKKFPSFMQSRMQGGTGFASSRVLRSFFLEYAERFGRHGPFQMPSSFNVVEAFLPFSETYMAFDLLEEHEYVVTLFDYLDWFTGEGFPADPGVLRDVLPEKQIHHYNMSDPGSDFSVETAGSTVRLVGVSLVRHGAELSIIAVAGEDPPDPSDDDVVSWMASDGTSLRSAAVQPTPDLNVSDRYLPELPSHSTVLLLARVDLERSTYDVRYVHRDVGQGYSVLTDDQRVLGDVAESRDAIVEQLGKYDGLFSATISLTLLPVYVLLRKSSLVQQKFTTELGTSRQSTRVRRVSKHLPRDEVYFHRQVSIVPAGAVPEESAEWDVEPPELEFASFGYWMPLSPGEIGEDQDGNSVVGKTWVQRTETWKRESLANVVLATTPPDPAGDDPGLVYLMRSGTHATDVYKIGLTRRDGESRAKELTRATGVPTKFEVLASWRTGDCSTAEKQIHARLSKFRVNKRREFFRAPISTLIRVIQATLEELERAV